MKAARDDAALLAVLDGFEQRRDRQFAELAGKPLKVEAKRPPVTEGRPLFTRDYSYSIIDFAMKTFWLGEPGEEANEALDENCRFYIEHQPERDDRDNFYWSADVLCRLVEFFGEQGTRAPGRLTAPTEQVVLEMMWEWLRTRSLRDDAECRESKTWHVWESENHHVQKFSTAWHFAKILKDKPAYRGKTLADGGTPREHFRAWTDYAREWVRERAKKSLFVETANAGYNIHSLKGVYNFYDFSPDAELKALSGRLLDLYWATWAEEQIDGVRGGGKARVYPGKGSLLGNDPMRRLAWYHLGIGEPRPPKGNDFTVLTSSHRLPPVVLDIALDRVGRGVYEIRQRPLGLAVSGYHTCPDYRLQTDWGGILRYSYCTPEFILGSLMFSARPSSDWTHISSQNRWHGAIFGGHPDARIVPQCLGNPTHYAGVMYRTYNAHWSVQSRGTLITQRLETGENALEMRVWISGAGLGHRVERGGWVFVESAGAYAAVRPACDGFHWEPQDGVQGEWLVGEDPNAPVIIDIVLKAAYPSYEAFQDRVLSNALKMTDGTLEYQSLYGDRFEFFTGWSQNPLVNGAPVNLRPDKAFDSPFIQEDWDSGVVTLAKDQRQTVLTF
jgi:hypothetical protein